MKNLESMLALARSGPSGLAEALSRCRGANDYEFVSRLFFVVRDLQQEGTITSAEATAALLGLVQSLPVWAMEPWAPEGILNMLEKVVWHGGLPVNVDLGPLADLLVQASAQDELTMGNRLDLLNLALLNLCSTLARRRELAVVLRMRSGAREAVRSGITRLRKRLSEEDRELYSDQIELVLLDCEG